jgi:hypothetical protein
MSKKALIQQVESSGGSYICLTHHETKSCKPIGYVTSLHALKSHIAAYASDEGVTKVTAIGGRNIMDKDGPTAVFSVNIVIL